MKPKTMKTYRHTPWEYSEVSLLVSLRLLDSFPKHHDKLLDSLKADFPEHSIYLDIIAERNQLEYFRHWICPNCAAWYRFDWKTTLEDDYKVASGSQVREQIAVGPVFLGIEATEPEPLYGPRNPTMSPEEAARSTAEQSTSVYLPIEHAREPEKRPSDHRCLFIKAPSDRSRVMLGELFLDLCRLNKPWLGSELDPDIADILGALGSHMTLPRTEFANADFKVIQDAYQKQLRKLPADYCRQVALAYWDANITNVIDVRKPLDNSVFWAARMLELFAPQDYEEYLRRVREFRRRVLPLVARLVRRNVPATDLKCLVRDFRSQLEGDGLLNVMFHASVFSGHFAVHPRPARPGPIPDSTCDHAIQVAMTIFRRCYPRGAPRQVRRILRDGHCLSHVAIKESISLSTGRTSSSFVSPLISVIRRPVYFVTPGAVESAYARVIGQKRSRTTKQLQPTRPSQK